MQIDIISPEGKLTPYPLDPQRGIANIGRNWANEIVLPNTQVAEFHALLDYRQQPYRLFALAGASGVRVGQQFVAPEQSVEVAAGETIDVADFLLTIRVSRATETSAIRSPGNSGIDTAKVLTGGVSTTTSLAQSLQAQPEQLIDLESQARQAIFLGLPMEARFEPKDDDKPDLSQAIIVEIPERKGDVEVLETAIWSVRIKNGGRRVGLFQVHLESWQQGRWVRIETDEEERISFQHFDQQKRGEQPNEVNLNEDEATTLNVRITPPRHPSCLTGKRQMAIVVTSGNYPGCEARLGISLNIRPFYQITVGQQVRPQQQTIPYRQRFGRFELPIQNHGNANAAVQVSGTDTEQNCIFEFEEANKEAQIGVCKFTVLAGQTANVVLRVRPKTRRLIANKATKHNLYLVTEVVGGTQSVESRHPVLFQNPRYRYWQIVLFSLLLCVLTLRGVIWLLTPKIHDFDPVVVKNYQLGELGTLTWRTSPFPRKLTIIEQPKGANSTTTAFSMTDLNFDQRLNRTFPFVAKSGQDYVLQMESQLNRVSDWTSFLGIATVITKTASISVETSTLSVTLKVNPLSVTVGEEVKIEWEPNLPNVDEYTLLADGAPLPVATPGSYIDRPQKNTNYQLEVSGTLIAPTRSASTPIEVKQPAPLIEEFGVAPAEVAPGAQVNLFWRVTGGENLAVSLIRPLSTTLPVEGSLPLVIPTVEQLGAYTFTLKAVAEGTPVSTPGIAQRSISIQIAAATPMPPVPTPDIRRFNVEPKEVPLGQSVRVSWDVVGASEIAIIPVIGKVDVNAGERLAPMTTPGPQQIILQAKAVAPGSTGVAEEIIDVNVLAPTATPTPTGTPKPPPSTPLPPEIKDFRILATPVQGGNFTFQWNVVNTFSRLEIRSLPPANYPPLTLTENAGTITNTSVAQQPATFELVAFQGNDEKAVTTTSLVVQARKPNVRSISITDLAENEIQDCSRQENSTITICNLSGTTEQVIVGWEISDATKVSVDAPVRCINGANDNLTANGRCIFTVDKNVQLIIRAENAPTDLVKVDTLDLWQVSLVREQFTVVGPPPNFNVELKENDTQAKLTWEAPKLDNNEDPNNLLVYRIYRGFIGGFTFGEVAELQKTETTWTDIGGQSPNEVCGKAYYMVSVYKAINSSGAEEERESDPTATFNTLPCQ